LGLALAGAALMAKPLRLGISPCPNDTFAFHGLLSGAVLARGLELEIELADVEELNQRLARGELDAAKASFAAVLGRGAELCVLPAGAALGFGVGPLVLAPPARAPKLPVARDTRVLAPGEHTTATLLWRLFHPGEGRLEQVRFSEILPALERGEAELGLAIHEGRFTYRRRGLERVEDLGERWERATGRPLPLGGIAARRDLGAQVLAQLARAIADSIEHAWNHREEALATMRAHAQEQSEEALWAHVELYVGDETRALSSAGREALAELDRRARQAGLVPRDAPPLEVFGTESGQNPPDS
jgi:1,4-dihydroxy-6-naphthoate synthase